MGSRCVDFFRFNISSIKFSSSVHINLSSWFEIQAACYWTFLSLVGRILHLSLLLSNFLEFNGLHLKYVASDMWRLTEQIGNPLKIVVFWDVASWSLSHIDWSFRRWWWRLQAPLKRRSVSTKTFCNIPEDNHLHTRCRKNLKSYFKCVVEVLIDRIWTLMLLVFLKFYRRIWSSSSLSVRCCILQL
jgi:hypothetical protein